MRNRYLIAASFLLVIFWGLASRKYPFIFPAAFGKYPGDALWALMVFLALAFLRPGSNSHFLSAFALCFASLIEISQLYQAPWINDIRATTIGHLILGSTFMWGDLLAYLVGVCIGFTVDKLLISKYFVRSLPESDTK